jgi:hypothetical protein
MTITPRYQNQGQQIVLGWDNEGALKDWTAYTGTDGEPFLPPSDRIGYSDGVDRSLPTGAILMAGVPISRQVFPWLSDGQIDYLETTFNNQNVTVTVHRPNSIGKSDVFAYNAVFNLDMNQFRRVCL